MTMVAKGYLVKECAVEIEKDLNGSMQRVMEYCEYVGDAVERRE